MFTAHLTATLGVMSIFNLYCLTSTYSIQFAHKRIIILPILSIRQLPGKRLFTPEVSKLPLSLITNCSLLIMM